MVLALSYSVHHPEPLGRRIMGDVGDVISEAFIFGRMWVGESVMCESS